MIEKEELLSIVPHRGKMLLLSRVIEYDLMKRTLTAECDVTEDCLFYDPALGGVPAWVSFEYMAQTIGALSGIWVRENGEEPKLGFILSISSMHIGLPFFKAGSKVEIRVKEAGYLDQVHNFDGIALLNGRKVMEGKLTVMDASDEQIKSLLKEYDSIG